MTDGFKPLLRTDVPRADESFWSYIIRLAALNDYPNCHWILNLAGIRKEHDLFGPSIVFRGGLDLSILARLSGVEIAKLTSLTYPPASEFNSQHKQWFAEFIIPRNLIRLAYGKVCPPCLRESNYCRRMWDLIPLTACPDHRVLLIYECPKCSNRITWARNRVSLCRCGFDWKDITQTNLNDTELEVARHIYNLCDPKLRQERPFESLKGSPILNLDLADFCTAIIFMAGQYSGEGTGTGRGITRQNRYSTLHIILNKAFSVFKDWPGQFHRFLDEHRGQTKNMIGCIQRDFGRFHYLLHGSQSVLSSPSFDFMRSAYAEYMKCYWIGGSTSRSKFLRETKVAGEYISKNDAMVRFGLFPGILEALISAGRLKYVIKKAGSKQTYLIKLSSIEKLKHELPDPIPLCNAANMLGITSAQARDLVISGRLIPLRGPDIDGYRTWAFSRSTLEKLQHAKPSFSTRPQEQHQTAHMT